MPRVRRVIVSNEETQFTRLQVTSNAKARDVVSVVGGVSGNGKKMTMKSRADLDVNKIGNTARPTNTTEPLYSRTATK
jgi:hypothetical protein